MIIKTYHADRMRAICALMSQNSYKGQFDNFKGLGNYIIYFFKIAKVHKIHPSHNSSPFWASNYVQMLWQNKQLLRILSYS